MMWEFIGIFFFLSGISLILHDKYYVTTLSAANNRNGIQAGLHFVMGKVLMALQRCQVLIPEPVSITYLGKGPL